MTRKIAAALAAVGLMVAPAAFAAEQKKDAKAEKEPSDRFTQGKQGEAKDALEKTAGQKTGDTKVPDVPPPTPVKN